MGDVPQTSANGQQRISFDIHAPDELAYWEGMCPRCYHVLGTGGTSLLFCQECEIYWHGWKDRERAS